MPPRLAIRAVLAALALFATGFAPLRADEPRTVRLTILHTNDTHGHLLPYSYPETFDPGSDLARLRVRRNIGGAARRATLANRIRREQPTHETLLIDAGDVCDGTPFSTEFHGDADIAAMNAMGYDIACPGNHEFNNTLAQVRKLIADAKYPILCANVSLKTEDKPLYSPFIIKEIGGAKIAFFGLLTRSAAGYPAAKNDLVVADPVETARRLVPELRRQADFVVAVTHIGVEEDRILAASVDGIDVIVGGHSHTMLPSPLFIGQVPTDHLQSVHGTIIVQNFQWAGTLGRLDLTLFRSEAGSWSVQKYNGRLLPITSELPEDPGTASVVNSFWDRIKTTYAEVIGQAADDITEKGADFAEYHLMADALRATTSAEVHLENMGGVRAPLVKGPITYGDLVTLDPFSNTVVTFSLSGRQLRTILEQTQPAVSGMRYVLDAGKLVEATVNGQSLQDDRVYRASSNSFFAGQPLFEGVPDRQDTGVKRLDALIAYIRAQKTVRPVYDGRRILRNMNVSY